MPKYIAINRVISTIVTVKKLVYVKVQQLPRSNIFCKTLVSFLLKTFLKQFRFQLMHWFSFFHRTCAVYAIHLL
jgi:hypothetical protein